MNDLYINQSMIPSNAIAAISARFADGELFPNSLIVMTVRPYQDYIPQYTQIYTAAEAINNLRHMEAEEKYGDYDLILSIHRLGDQIVA